MYYINRHMPAIELINLMIMELYILEILLIITWVI